MAESARADLAQGTVTRRRDQPLEHRLRHDRPLDPAAMAAYLQQTTGNHSLNQLIEEREEHAGLEEALSAEPQDRAGLARPRLEEVPAEERQDPIVNALKSRGGNATGNAAGDAGGGGWWGCGFACGARVRSGEKRGRRGGKRGPPDGRGSRRPGGRCERGLS